MTTSPLQRQVPLTVISPPWQFSALVLTQVPPFALALVGMTLKPAGHRHKPLLTVPPSQTTLSSALRVGANVTVGGNGVPSATQCPLVSRCVLIGHVH